MLSHTPLHLLSYRLISPPNKHNLLWEEVFKLRLHLLELAVFRIFIQQFVHSHRILFIRTRIVHPHYGLFSLTPIRHTRTSYTLGHFAQDESDKALK